MAEPRVGLKWHLVLAWHKDNAGIGQVERQGTEDGGIALEGHWFQNRKSFLEQSMTLSTLPLTIRLG